MNVISVLMMMRIWDSHGERFYHTPSDKILRAEAKQAIDEELETFFLPYTIKHFDMLFSTRCFWVEDLMCFQWIFDWSVSLIAKWREYYMLTFAGEFSQDIIVIGKMNLWELCTVYPDEALSWF